VSLRVYSVSMWKNLPPDHLRGVSLVENRVAFRTEGSLANPHWSDSVQRYCEFLCAKEVRSRHAIDPQLRVPPLMPATRRRSPQLAWQPTRRR
jgi:hypothetical protein